MKLIQIVYPEANANHETRYVTEGGYFSVKNNGTFITVIPFLPGTYGIATETNLLNAMVRSQALKKSYPTEFPEKEKPADTPNAAGSSESKTPIM